MYENAKTYVSQGYRKRWDDYYRVYMGQRVNPSYIGVSEPVIRESHTIIETLVANIAGGNPKFEFVPTNEEQSKDVEVLNGMLEYYLICNQMGIKQQEWVREMLLYGTGILHITWEKGKPRIDNIPLRDFFVDPTATDLASARYAGFEYLASKADLAKQEIYDADKDKWVPRYKNLNKIGKNNFQDDTQDGDVMDKKFKDLFKGSTLGEKATEDQVHVIKLYDLTTGRLVEIGNKKEFIYDQTTWAQRDSVSRDVQIELSPDEEMISAIESLEKIDPFLPFAVLRDYVDSSQFYGEGEMALLIGDAELLNDYEAMVVDNNAYQNTPMYWVDPAFSDLIPEIETTPGAVYPIPRNAMGAIERPQLTTDLENKEVNIMNRMRRSTAADEAVQGVSQQRSRTTATEIQSQLSQAQQRFSTKITNLESEGFAQLGSTINKMQQIFVTQQTAVRIVGPQGVSFKDYDPWEFNGEYEAHVQLETTIQRKKLEVGQKNNQIYEVLKENDKLNQVEIDRWITQQLDPEMTDDKFNKFILPEQPKPEVDPKEYLNLDYKDATPWTKMQIEKKLELEPDPAHMGEIQNHMINTAADAVNRLDQTVDADGNPIEGVMAPPGMSPVAGM